MPNPPPVLSPYFDTAEAAAFLRLSARTLEGKRTAKTGPPFYRLGTSKRAKVIYLEKDLIAWVAKHANKVGD
jgi:hypothetical protein